jgi:hypothetical protein
MFPVGAAPGQKWEIEFTANTWTDVTADVEYVYASPPQIHYGRTSPHAQPGPGSMTFTLRNETGKYTPFRQVLTNGQAHPYWPNVIPRKRVRYSYTVAGVPTYRFFGYIKGWPPAMMSGVRPYVTITATTRDEQLARVTMTSPVRQEISLDTPVLWWPLDDPAGATQAATSPTVSAYLLGAQGTTGPLLFGDAGPGVGDGTGVKFTPLGQNNGQILIGRVLPALNLGAYTIECYINAGTAGPAWIAGILSLVDAVPNEQLTLTLDGTTGYPGWEDSAGGFVNTASIQDGRWHHIAVTRATNGGATTLYVDGAAVNTSGSSASWTQPTRVTVGDIGPAIAGGGRYQGNIGQVAVYTSALSATRIAAHAAARNGYTGDTTSARVARYLTAAGVTTGTILDTGQTTAGTYPQAGKDVVQACQDMTTTEGGGAAFWVRPAGAVRFANRRFRDASAPVLTLDALVDLDATVYDPAYDESTLINSSTVSRADESGTLSTQTYTDTVSVATFGPTTDDATTYTQSDGDALNLAQDHVAGNAYPAFRLDQLAANFHASTSNKYAALAAVEIGTRLRIVNLPPGAAPLGTLDQFIEGWTEYPHPNTYRVAFDTSPMIDERIKLDDATYGPLGCFGQTLNAALTPTATSVVIATSGTNPTFTSVAGMYPMIIQIGQEQIQLNSAPGGSTSPQTFSGVTRGVNGTFAAAQAAGAVIALAPATALAL